jgi:hypothetical protein
MSGGCATLSVLFCFPTVVVLTKEISGFSPTWVWAKFLSAEVLVRTQLVLQKFSLQIFFGCVCYSGTIAVARWHCLKLTLYAREEWNLKVRDRHLGTTLEKWWWEPLGHLPSVLIPIRNHMWLIMPLVSEGRLLNLLVIVYGTLHSPLSQFLITHYVPLLAGLSQSLHWARSGL